MQITPSNTHDAPHPVMPIAIRNLTLTSPEATQDLGQSLAGLLGAGDLILLSGDLGAGKTHLARAVVQALAGAEQDVPSPTFTLIQRYETPSLIITHADLYRIDAVTELEELGLDEALEEGALLVEWPDRAAGLWPESRLEIELSSGTDPTERLASLTGRGLWSGRLKTWMPDA